MIRTREEREVELKVAERECRFVDGLQWRLRDALQQLRREENEILGMLAQTNGECRGSAAVTEPDEEIDTDCVRVPRSPRTPPLRPFLALDPMRQSGNPLLPHWRLESEDMPSPPPDDDFRDSAADAGGSSSTRAEASCGSSGQPSFERQPDAGRTQPVHGLEAQIALAATPASAASQGAPRQDHDGDGGQYPQFASAPSSWQPSGSLEDTPSPCSSTTTAETRPDMQRRPPKWRFFRPRGRRRQAILSPPASSQKRRRLGASAKPAFVGALLP